MRAETQIRFDRVTQNIDIILSKYEKVDTVGFELAYDLIYTIKEVENLLDNADITSFNRIQLTEKLELLNEKKKTLDDETLQKLYDNNTLNSGVRQVFKTKYAEDFYCDTYFSIKNSFASFCVPVIASLVLLILLKVMDIYLGNRVADLLMIAQAFALVAIAMTTVQYALLGLYVKSSKFRDALGVVIRINGDIISSDGNKVHLKNKIADVFAKFVSNRLELMLGEEIIRKVYKTDYLDMCTYEVFADRPKNKVEIAKILLLNLENKIEDTKEKEWRKKLYSSAFSERIEASAEVELTYNLLVMENKKFIKKAEEK